MELSNDILIQFIILVLGLFGFWVAKHIRKHKKQNKPLVCPVGFDCHTVVHSDYSRFMNIPVEVLGMFYYILIVISYFLFIFMDQLVSSIIFDFISMVSLIAFLFSSYLIAIQIFVLKKGCSWCIVSAIVSALIFVLTMVK